MFRSSFYQHVEPLRAKSTPEGQACEAILPRDHVLHEVQDQHESWVFFERFLDGKSIDLWSGTIAGYEVHLTKFMILELVAAAIILGFGRAIGETMVVLMASGNAAVMELFDPTTSVWSEVLENVACQLATALSLSPSRRYMSGATPASGFQSL